MPRRSTQLLPVLVVLASLAPATANAATAGALRPAAEKPCILHAEFTDPGCLPGRALRENTSEFALSPGGEHLYAASFHSSSLTIFDRDASNGLLSQKPGGAGCLVDDEVMAPTGCVNAPGLHGANGVAVSPDGKHVYVASADDDAVSAFARNPDGTVAFIGCLGLQQPECSVGRGLESAAEVSISPDGSSVYTAGRAENLGGIASFTRNPAMGGLTQLAASDGCIRQTTAESCTADTVIKFPREIVVGPGGNHVYVADGRNEAIIVYTRNTGSGALTRLAGADGGCLAGSAIGDCKVHPLLAGTNHVENVALSPDASKLYISGHASSRIITLARQANGGVGEIPGACITEVGNATCPGSAHGVRGPYGLAVAGNNLYVAVNDSPRASGLVTFDIGADGSLVPKPKPFGCVAANFEGCTPFPGMFANLDVVVSPDGRFVYGWGWSRLVAAYRDRAPVCAPVGVTVEAGKSVVVALSCPDPDGEAVTYEITEQPATGVLAAPAADGTTTYIAAADAGGKTTTFKYRARAFGAVSDEATGTVTITVPPPPKVIKRITSTISHLWAFSKRRTTLKGLTVRDLPAGAKIEVRCRAKKRRCPFKKLTKSFRTATARANLLRTIFKRKRMRRFGVPARIELRITAPDHIGKALTFTTRPKKVPRRTPGCIPLGSTKIKRTC